MENKGINDVFVSRLNNNFTKAWFKTFGGSKNDFGYSVAVTSDNGIIIGGATESSDGDINKNRGYDDGWFFKLDYDGKKIWQKTIGGSQSDQLSCVFDNGNNSYIIVGNSLSNDGDINNNHGNKDIFIHKYKYQ